MPLDSSGILKGQRLKAKQLKDLYDLLTGVMVDQPVTLANTVTVLGTIISGGQTFQSGGDANVPLAARAHSATQTADLFQVQDYLTNNLFRIDAGGTVQAPKLNGAIVTGSQIPGSQLGTDAARLTLLVNGGFEVWQRGNGPFTATSAATPMGPDRWFVFNGSGAGNVVCTKETATVDAKSGASAKLVYTAGAADTQPSLYQSFSFANESADLKGATVSTSIRVNASAAGRVRLWWYDGVAGGATRQYGAYNLTAGTWETLSLTFAIAATATQLQWGVELLAGSSSTVYVDNATRVFGPVPMDYLPLTPADELARCLRYYQRWGADAAQYIDAVGAGTSTTAAFLFLPMQATMGGNPTFTVSGVGQWSMVNGSFSTAFTCTALTLFQMRPQVAMLSTTIGSASLVAAQPAWLQAAANGSWLALEWNP